MTGPTNDQKRPNGECAGRDLPDRGHMTSVTDTHGADKASFGRGHTGSEKIGAHTKSDK